MSSIAASRRFDTLFAVLFAAGYLLAALAVHLAFFPIGDLGVETDFYGELVIGAQRLWAGEFSVLNYPYKGPLYSFVLLPIYAVVRLFGADWYFAGIVLNLLCASASLILGYRLLLAVFNRRVAVWGTVLSSSIYEFFLHAHKASSDLLFLVLFQATVLLLVLHSASRRKLVAAGILSGLAFLTRYNGLILPAAALVMLVLVNPSRLTGRRKLNASAWYLAAFLLVVLPWYAANYLQTGHILATHNLQNIFVEEYYGGAYAGLRPSEPLTTLSEVVLHDPGHFLKVTATNVVKHLNRDRLDLLCLWPSILFLLGLVRLAFDPLTRRHWAYLVFPLCYFLAMCTVYNQPRFRFPLIAAYCGIGMAFLFGADRNRPSRFNHEFRTAAGAFRKDPGGTIGEGSDGAVGNTVSGSISRPARLPLFFTGLVLAGLGLYQVSNIIEAERFYYARRPLYILEAASFLKSDATERGATMVMARKPHIAYYSELRQVPFPLDPGTAEDFVRQAVLDRADYVVVSDIERDHYPNAHYLGFLEKIEGVASIYRQPSITIYALSEALREGARVQDVAVSALTRQLEQAQAAGDLLPIVGLSRQIADEHLINRNWQAAMAASRRGLDAALEIKTADLPPEETAEIATQACQLKNDLAMAYVYLGRHEEGIALLLDEAPIALSECGPQQQATAHSLLARHYKERGDIAQARRHLLQARNIYLTLGDKFQAAGMDRALATLPDR
jgi:hypothetical protein